MTRPTTFPTIPLEEIRSLMNQPEPEDILHSGAAVCLNCGHPASDHDLNSDTCWRTTHENGEVAICGCRSYSSLS